MQSRERALEALRISSTDTTGHIAWRHTLHRGLCACCRHSAHHSDSKVREDLVARLAADGPVLCKVGNAAALAVAIEGARVG